jgi:hypothetical protein
MCGASKKSWGYLAKTKTFPSEFIAVDLDIKSRSDLSILVNAWDKRAILDYLDNSRNRHWLRVFLTSQPKSPTDAVRRFAKLIHGLPRQARTVWTRATSKEFDIGIQAGYEGRSGEWVLEPEVLQTVSDLGGRLRITVYSPLLLTDANAKRKSRRSN